MNGSEFSGLLFRKTPRQIKFKLQADWQARSTSTSSAPEETEVASGVIPSSGNAVENLRPKDSNPEVSNSVVFGALNFST